MSTNEKLFNYVRACYEQDCSFEEIVSLVGKEFPDKSYTDLEIARILDSVLQGGNSESFLNLDTYKERDKVLGYIKEALYCDEGMDLSYIYEILVSYNNVGPFTVESILKAVKEVKGEA